MRKLAFVGSTTLSSFYKDVLRRRMALLLMLLALMASRSGGGYGTAPGGKSTGKDPGTRKDGRPAINKMLWNVDTLGIVLALHLLWLMRFLAMLVEDVIVDSGMDKQGAAMKSQVRTHISTLVLLAAVACSVTITDWPTHLVGLLGAPHNARLSAEAIRATRLIRWSELSATLVALFGPLTKLSSGASLRLFPRQISLPSPSHAPKLGDIVPLPPGLSDVLLARSPENMSRSGLNQTPGMTRRHRMIAPRGAMGADADAIAAREGLLRPPQPEAQPQTVAQGTIEGTGPGLRRPLRFIGTDGKRAARQRGVRVKVDTIWLTEHLVTLYGHLVGALNFVVVVLSMPSLSPASFPLLFAELGAVSSAWTGLRQAIECLEFVRRRFGSQAQSVRRGLSGETADALQDEDTDEQMCAMCFEPVKRPITSSIPSSDGSDTSQPIDAIDCCTLDCQHQLHAICLVHWLAKQSFCPCCHAGLSATPPSGNPASPHAATPSPIATL